MRTLSVTDTDAERDIDGLIIEGLESLRQRVVQAILFQFGDWFADTRRGLPYRRIIGHETTQALAARAITQAIVDEGQEEVTGVSSWISTPGFSATPPRRTYDDTGRRHRSAGRRF